MQMHVHPQERQDDMARQRTYQDPALELTHRLTGDPVATYELASDMTDEEAEEVIAALDEVEAEEKARGIVSSLRQQGHVL